MKKLIIIKYGELSTKKDNINYFLSTLKDNIKNSLKTLKLILFMIKEECLFITKKKSMIKLLKN